MVRLTAELILTSPAFVNPLKERELDLRGNKIPQIENLGATEDHFDVLDLSDNDITKFDGFPLLNRVTSIFASNNRIATIAEDLGSKVANLETLVLINNRVENLADLDPLATCKKLSTLSLLKNNVTNKPHYRLYLINRVPSLKILDFRKVKEKERTEAKKLFGGKEGEKLKKDIASLRSVPTQAAANEGLTPEQKQRIKDAIGRAQSLEEIQKLELVLQSGKMPKELAEKQATEADAQSKANGDAMDVSK
jgi:U2 small nuclear ribonucleoprotein A'